MDTPRLEWLKNYPISRRPSLAEKEKLLKDAQEQISFTGQAIITIWAKLVKAKSWSRPRDPKSFRCGNPRSGKFVIERTSISSE